MLLRGSVAEAIANVAPLYRFKTDAEAIKKANDTEFGLAVLFVQP
jgi:succinate-semialdehyde dehydrogenase / glutarate-semialdehyde dehydrogenase